MTYIPKPRWTFRQKIFLIENFDTMRDVDIAQRLGKTKKAIQRMRARLELNKECGRGIVRATEETLVSERVRRRIAAGQLKVPEVVND